MSIASRVGAALAVFRRQPVPAIARNYGFQDWIDLYQNAWQQQYSGMWPGYQMTYGKDPAEPIANDFAAYVGHGLLGNSVVWSLESKRLEVFSQARFQYQQMRQGRPANLFGDPDLDILETPWPSGTTGDLLAKMLLDADFAGNAWLAPLDGEIVRLRPDWVEIVLQPRMLPLGPSGERVQVGFRQVGILYYENGLYSGAEPAVFLPGEYAHFAPKPDPLATYRGMSWITPVIRELQADTQATKHKLKFFENGATPNVVIALPKEITPTQFEAYKKVFDAGHKGVEHAYESLLIGGGADVTVVGANMQQLDFKVTQGAGETRLAAAAGVHPVVAGLSEGMQGSSLNAGNFGSAKRLFVDTTCRHLWQNAAGSLAPLVPAKQGARLWYDDRDIPFLFEDKKDIAEIQQMQMSAWRQAVDGGMKPDAATEFIRSNDLSVLIGQHSGLYSVQLQPPGSGQPQAGGVDPKAQAARSAVVSRKFNPTEPRDPHSGKWIGGPGGAVHGAEKLADALTGQDALDASPAKLVDDGLGLLNPRHVRGELTWSSGDPGWSAAEADAHLTSLERYRGGDFSTVNKSLRGMPFRPIFHEDEKLSTEEFHAKVARDVQHLDDVMEHSRLTHTVQVMRGTATGEGVFGAALAGDLTGFEWTEDAFTSTTVSPEIAGYFTISGLLMDITVPRGVGAVNLSGLKRPDGEDDEAELLLERGLRMRVVADTGLGDPRRLQVEVVRG